jgi:hypothetical protein
MVHLWKIVPRAGLRALRQIKNALCREPEVRTRIAASPNANFGFKAALEP